MKLRLTTLLLIYYLRTTRCINPGLKYIHWRFQWGTTGTRPLGTRFFCFNIQLFFSKCRHPLTCLALPPTGNPGSATDTGTIEGSIAVKIPTILFKLIDQKCAFVQRCTVDQYFHSKLRYSNDVYCITLNSQFKFQGNLDLLQIPLSITILATLGSSVWNRLIVIYWISNTHGLSWPH